MTATEGVPCQLDAYNAHDLVAFPATYSKNAELTSLASANRPVIGEGAIAELYGTKVFNVAGDRAELPGRRAGLVFISRVKTRWPTNDMLYSSFGRTVGPRQALVHDSVDRCSVMPFERKQTP